MSTSTEVMFLNDGTEIVLTIEQAEALNAYYAPKPTPTIADIEEAEVQYAEHLAYKEMDCDMGHCDTCIEFDERIGSMHEAIEATLTPM